ncbi:MAG: hypothetical protein KDK89_11215 [Alphaproteobacteria bacterium]|nr:hypothetical protein [Alphaproteobacteria bacterium]
MGWALTFDPFFGWVMLALFAAAGVGLMLLAAAAQARGWWLRGLALLLLLAALANPTLRNEKRDNLSDIAVAVIDRSLSQTSGNRTAQTDEAAAALQAAAQRLGNTELRVVQVRSGISADDDGTRAFAALDRALADIPPERFAGAIMVTDGQVHDVPADIGKAGIDGPLHGLITGSRREIDRKVVIDRSPRFGIVGKDQTIVFHVEEVNGPGGPVDVTLRLGSNSTETITVTPGIPVEYSLTVEHGGQNIAEVSVPALDGEISTRNNRAIAVIEGIRDRLRVLLVSGEPHPGERTWRNLLKADASVDLVHFTILRPPEKQDGTPVKELALIAFPTRELFIDKLDEFDLVIFDRYRRQAILPAAYLSNVARYVRDGGAVLISSGPDFASEDGLYMTPLADVIAAAPTGEIIEGPFRPKLTPAGRKHPVTRDLPGGGETPSWGRWFRLVGTSEASGDTVMSGTDDRALLVLSHAGEGRVAQMLSDQGWLWARGYDGGGPQTELLRRIAHWLMKEPDLEEESLHATQQGSQLVIERRTMADSAEPVTVTLPTGATVQVPLVETAPGQWQGRLDVSEAGLHRLTDGKLDAVAAAGSADARETTDLIATDKLLAPVAAATGGSVNWLENGLPQLVKVGPGRQASGTGWVGLRANGAYRVAAVTTVPLFATLLALAALLFGLCAMWYREGR